MEVKKDINPLELEETPLAFRFHILSKKYTAAVAYSLEGVDMERHFQVLTVIEKHGAVTQQCLANCFCIDKATIVRIIDYLTERGLVERAVNPKDRRAHLIRATNKAKKNLPQILAAFEQTNEEAFKGFSKTEKKQFIEMSNKIMHNLVAIPAKKGAEK